MGSGELVAEPLMCGLSVETPWHQFHTVTGLVLFLSSESSMTSWAFEPSAVRKTAAPNSFAELLRICEPQIVKATPSPPSLSRAPPLPPEPISFCPLLVHVHWVG